jgi:3-hydroxymyristoyl/3-hydroxydecanoyl-(acyl carrier protein) dehydratase
MTDDLDHRLPIEVPRDHPALAGHFPGRPIVPGVVLLDLTLAALAQALHRPEQGVEIRSAKFPSPAGPGDVLELHYSPSAEGARFAVRAGGRTVASGVLVWVGART